jgi:hypothetical protein
VRQFWLPEIDPSTVLMLETWQVIVRWYLKFGRATMPTLTYPMW